MIVMIQSLVVEILPISIKTQRSTFDLFESMQGFVYKYNDIVVVSSKFVSMSEGSIVKLSSVKATKMARDLSTQNHMDAKLAELMLRESEYVMSGVRAFCLLSDTA